MPRIGCATVPKPTGPTAALTDTIRLVQGGILPLALVGRVLGTVEAKVLPLLLAGELTAKQQKALAEAHEVWKGILPPDLAQRSLQVERAIREAAVAWYAIANDQLALEVHRADRSTRSRVRRLLDPEGGRAPKP